MIVGLTLGIMHLAVKLCCRGDKTRQTLKLCRSTTRTMKPRVLFLQKNFCTTVRPRGGVTFQRVEGVAAQAEGAITHDAAETLAVEEVALGAEPLHHINPLGAEVAGVAAPEARRKVFTAQTLKDRGRRRRRRRKSLFDSRVQTCYWLQLENFSKLNESGSNM